jgi:transposase-like protein
MSEPRCPKCSSRQTARCGSTDDGLVYICSPCCEAFFLDDAPREEHPGWLALVIVLLLLLTGLAWYASRSSDAALERPPLRKESPSSSRW